MLFCFFIEKYWLKKKKSARRYILCKFVKARERIFFKAWKIGLSEYALKIRVTPKKSEYLATMQSGLCVDCHWIMWGIQQKGSLKHLLQNSSPPLPVKMADFMTYCHFVSSWKSLYRERCVVFDGAIKIVHRLLQNYVRNSTQGFS